jgi:hypothetical protein
MLQGGGIYEVHFLWTGLFGLLALLWILAAIDLAFGVPRVPSLADVTPLIDEKCPAVSILFAARDESEKLSQALETMVALDYPRYEVIAVDDRSIDRTPDILKAASQKYSRLKSLRIDSLPADWLGKPHALEMAFERSSGEWLVFTDADVHFEPDLLRRAIALAELQGWDHMPLLGKPKLFTFGEKIAMTYFGFGFIVGTRPWSVTKPRSKWYAGVGAFQLIRRSTYEAIGRHTRLAMEVVDDLKLGKLVKREGFRSGVAKAGNSVSLHWHAGIRQIIRGTTKNFFAISGFRLWLSLGQISGVLLLSVIPWLALPFAQGWPRVFAATAVAIAVIAQAGVSIEFGVSPLYALSHPVGAIIFSWMLARSVIVTLRQGGIVWRGTFYPLSELKRGVV